MDYDLKIAGGLIVDGTDAEPVQGDVAISNGRIAAVGPNVKGAAKRTFDAGGLVVSPGFIDTHTHYDAQVFWDRMMTVSPWHGVTTAVMGNCGFGVAPTHPDDRKKMLQSLEKVEGMDFAALEGGMGYDWPFITFPEFLDAIEKRGVAINATAYVGHTPLRLYVMGEDSFEREATPDEVEKMRQLVREAMRVGAAGFATSKGPHVGYMGRPVPSRASSLSEIYALASVLSEFGRGAVEASIGPDLMFDQWAEIMRVSKRPFTAAFTAKRFGPDNGLPKVREMQAQGLAMVPQVTPRPNFQEYGLDDPYPFMNTPYFKPIAEAKTHEDRLRVYSDPGFRKGFREGIADNTIKPFRVRWNTEKTWISYSPREPELNDRSLADLARERGTTAADLLLDISLKYDLDLRVKSALGNDDENALRELLNEPSSMLGLSDAGAHAGFMCDACIFTYLLGHWVRDLKQVSLQQAVRLMSSRPAEVFGLKDRGRLVAGAGADVVAFDLNTVGDMPLQRVRDLPRGAERVVAGARGIELVVVNGTPIRERGNDVVDPQGALPGKVLRPS